MARLIAITFMISIPALWLSAAQAAIYELPGDGVTVVGKIQHTKTGDSDTFVALSRKYDLGYRELEHANPDVDPWLPGDGTPITLPTRYVLPNAPHKGIVINLSEMRLYYYPPKGSKNAGKVVTMPLGIGRKGWQTPLGKTHVSNKIRKPSWTVPESIRKEHKEDGDPLPKVVPAGPDNPLGQYALQLALPGYLIHGTNKPRGIGMQVSHGCIRLYPEDIENLFAMLGSRTPVHIVDQPYKVGWNGQQLVMSAHPPAQEKKSGKQNYASWTKTIVTASNEHEHTNINWERAQSVASKANGIPQPITDLGNDASSEASHNSNADEQKTESASEAKNHS
ncbi:L,D-transpeptidase family protein [Salinisphaera sp. USBA-960]|nr:L,D-transpeptidase family protein [Salifodinibacter halophilus]NNC27155.1 L,D-transpeptidase family protein [Salifodinibacter halophilus]